MPSYLEYKSEGLNAMSLRAWLVILAIDAAIIALAWAAVTVVL